MSEYDTKNDVCFFFSLYFLDDFLFSYKIRKLKIYISLFHESHMKIL